jgi:hypothetical protein
LIGGYAIFVKSVTEKKLKEPPYQKSGSEFESWNVKTSSLRWRKKSYYVPFG